MTRPEGSCGSKHTPSFICETASIHSLLNCSSEQNIFRTNNEEASNLHPPAHHAAKELLVGDEDPLVQIHWSRSTGPQTPGLDHLPYIWFYLCLLCLRCFSQERSHEASDPEERNSFTFFSLVSTDSSE